jgi:hypothetical protein
MPDREILDVICRTTGGGLCSQVVAEDCDELFARAGRGSVAVAAGNPLS